jgi:hypothetical protein
LSNKIGYVGREKEETTVALNDGFKAKLSDCSPQNVKKIKNSEEVVNLVPFIIMNITSLKLRRLIEASDPVVKASCSY